MKINEALDERLSKEKEVVIVSGYKLFSEELDLIVQAIPQIKGYTIKNIVDESIIAGVVINIGSLTIDMSLKSTIQEFYSNLYGHTK